MRVVFSIITLSILIGCSNPDDIPWGVTMSNSQAVVLTFGARPSSACCLCWSCRPAFVVGGIMLKRAQQECDHYGKDAVLIREERAYSYTRYHYRCEARKADQVNE